MTELRREYETKEALLADLEQAKASGGLLVPTKEAVEARTVVKIMLALGKKVLCELSGETVYGGPAGEGFQCGVELKGDWKADLEKAAKEIAASDEDVNRWGKDSESLQHMIKDMAMNERIQLAIRGGREERRILMKDTYYAVHNYILKNPRITQDEVAHFAKMPSISAEMINTIASNSEWLGHAGVRLALVKNPKTPMPIAQKLMPQLQDGDLYKLAKSEHTKETIARLARKFLAQRGRPLP